MFAPFRAPFVSVVVSNYNYGRFLRDAIDSVRAQTYPSLECVIIDDCSTDDSGAVLDAIQRDWSDVKIIRAKTNAGQTATLLAGLKAARGNYILFLDSDDFLFPDCVAQQVAVHMSSRRAVGFSSCDALQIVDDCILTARNGNLAAAFMHIAKDAALVSDAAVARLAAEGIKLPAIEADRVRHVPWHWRGWPWATTSCMLFRRDALDLICGVPGMSAMRISTDTYLAHALNLLTGSLLLDAPLVGYRLHGANGFNTRAPLDGFLCHDRAHKPHVKVYRLFLDDLILRFAHYSKYIVDPERIFEICAMLDSPQDDAAAPAAGGKAPGLGGGSHFAHLLTQHRAALMAVASGGKPLVTDAMIAKWIRIARTETRSMLAAPDSPPDHDDGAKVSRTSIHDIAREVWFEKQRWGLPYKIGKLLKKPPAETSS